MQVRVPEAESGQQGYAVEVDFLNGFEFRWASRRILRLRLWNLAGLASVLTSGWPGGKT